MVQWTLAITYMLEAPEITETHDDHYRGLQIDLDDGGWSLGVIAFIQAMRSCGSELWNQIGEWNG